MLRICLALFLVCASAHAMAQNGRAGTANGGACQDTEMTARETTARDDAIPPGPNASRASAARTKYAKPASTAPRGGGSSDDNLPRQRGAKWHSFLPGMFR
jgi:hypothetical protein